MTPKQEAHLESLVKNIGNLVKDKYKKGQKEHGGNLFDLTARQLCDESILEAIDQLTYLLTLRPKLPEEKPKQRN